MTSGPHAIGHSEKQTMRILIYQEMWNDPPAIDPDQCGCEIWYDRSPPTENQPLSASKASRPIVGGLEHGE
jgi:hypothetical protein